MTVRHRQALAIALVTAAALCADQRLIAAPVARPVATSSAAGRLVERLSVRFCRVVPAAVRVFEIRREGVASAEQFNLTSHDAAGFQIRLSPLLLTLPPPTAA
ncbi:MAG TPA: hypothetical protein VH518_20165 [Tepidisphaeraceae bacterium]|jgi:hypothetical protein